MKSNQNGNSVLLRNTGEIEFPYYIMWISGCISCECYGNGTGKYIEEIEK